MNDKLLIIQHKLNVPKNQRNTFGNYNYRSCEDILEALKPLLLEQALLLTISDELVQVGERYYIKAECRLHGESGAGLETYGYAREEETKKGMDGSQITGAASSYARKYALNAMFLIDDTKDSDSTNTHDKTPEKTYTPGKFSKDPLTTPCPICQGEMWDNRGKKLNPKSPDFKCKDKNCIGVIWPPKDEFTHYDAEGNGLTDEQYEKYASNEDKDFDDVLDTK